MKTPTARKAAGDPKTDGRWISKKSGKFLFRNGAMELNVKLLQSPERKNHLIIIAGGLIDPEGLGRIFREVAETIQRVFNCRVLIDLEKAALRLDVTGIDELINELGPELRLGNTAIALVSPTDSNESEPVRFLIRSLMSQDLKVALFDTTKEAVAWLVANQP